MKFTFATFFIFCHGISVFGKFSLFLASLNGFFEGLSARKSCLEHYLNGEFELGVKPIRGDDGRVYEIACVAPGDGESDQFVKTMVHTALEQWMVVEPGKRSTVGFQ